jgi:hypothetical protein
MRTPVSVSKIAVMPFFLARAPVRSGKVFAFALRSNAAVEDERRGERPGPMLKRSGRGGSIDLMPKCRVCDETFPRGRRDLGSRNGGGSWKVMVALGGISASVGRASECEVGRGVNGFLTQRHGPSDHTFETWKTN